MTLPFGRCRLSSHPLNTRKKRSAVDSRKLFEQHLQTLNALGAGGISRGFGTPSAHGDTLQSNLRTQWEAQRTLLRRVLTEEGDPVDNLLLWRERTEGFIDKYPERTGWTDREGQSWEAHQVLEAIDRLLEQHEAWQEEADTFDDYDED